MTPTYILIDYVKSIHIISHSLIINVLTLIVKINPFIKPVMEK